MMPCRCRHFFIIAAYADDAAQRCLPLARHAAGYAMLRFCCFASHLCDASDAMPADARELERCH